MTFINWGQTIIGTEIPFFKLMIEIFQQYPFQINKSWLLLLT